MNINAILRRKKGEMPTAEEWNCLVQTIRRMAGAAKEMGGSYSIPKTFFRNETGSDMPPFSIFRAARVSNKDSGNSQNAEFEAVQIESDTEEVEFYGTNGKYPIKSGCRFWGYILDTVHDHLAIVHGVESDTAVTAGLSPQSFELEAGGKGLWVCGKAPFGEDLYFVRLAIQVGDKCVLCKTTNVLNTALGGYSVSLYANGKGNSPTGSGILYVTEMAAMARLPAGSWIIGHPMVVSRTNGDGDDDGEDS